MSNVLERILEEDADKLFKQRIELVGQKNEFTKQLAELGISKSVKDRKMNKNTPFIGERNGIVKQILRLEKEIGDINKLIAPIEAKRRRQGEDLRWDIIKEMFSAEQISIITEEMERRIDGQRPIKLDFNIGGAIKSKEIATKYKSMARDYLVTMIELRRNITDVIDKGCSKFDTQDFMNIISPINRAVPPISELEKQRRLHHL